MLGWSGPRTRSRAARVCSCRVMASLVRPAARRRWRGCCGRPGCRGGRGPGRVRGRRGSARQGDGLAGAARGPVGEGEVAAGSQGVGVVGAQDAFAGGQGLLAQGDGLAGAARAPVGAGEVAAGVQGLGVVGAQDRCLFGDQLLADDDGLRGSCRRARSGNTAPRTEDRSSGGSSHRWRGHRAADSDRAMICSTMSRTRSRS